MNKTWLVFKNEFITTFTRRSFLIALFGIPLISSLIVLVISSLGSRTTEIASQVFGSQPTELVEGIVDLNGLIQVYPTNLPTSRFLTYTNPEKAHQALTAGTISAYYIIPEDYLSTGEILYIRSDYNPLSGMDQAEVFRQLVRYNLIGGDEGLYRRLEQPMVVERTSLAEQPQRDQNNMLSFFLPYAVTMIFYIIILTSAGYMLNSVTKEKQNRMLEILMVSITPMQMLTGKIIALGLIGLLQTLIWSGTGYALLRLSGRTMDLPQAFQLPTSILAWGAIFFVLGYAVYASLMAAIGALVPNLREASQATTVIILPMIIPLLLINTLIENPHGGLSTALSIIPFTSPVSMMTRLAAGGVPTFQLLISVGLLALTGIIILRLVASMFRAQVLLSGQPFNFKRFFRLLAGKVV